MNDRMIRVERREEDGAVAEIWLDKPPLNLLTPDDYRHLSDTIRAVQADSKTRCMLLTGAGERAFSGGSDVRDYGDRTAEASLEVARVIRDALDSLRACAIPVVAAVNGPAVGGGFMMVAACDIIVSVDDAKFSLPEINFGIMGGPSYAMSMLPDKIVRYMALTGLPVAAAEMQACGAVNAIAPRHEYLERARSIARTIADKSPTGARFMKDAMVIAAKLEAHDAFRVEQLFTATAVHLADTKEALAARREKRKANFS